MKNLFEFGKKKVEEVRVETFNEKLMNNISVQMFISAKMLNLKEETTSVSSDEGDILNKVNSGEFIIVSKEFLCYSKVDKQPYLINKTEQFYHILGNSRDGITFYPSKKIILNHFQKTHTSHLEILETTENPFFSAPNAESNVVFNLGVVGDKEVRIIIKGWNANGRDTITPVFFDKVSILKEIDTLKDTILYHQSEEYKEFEKERELQVKKAEAKRISDEYFKNLQSRARRKSNKDVKVVFITTENINKVFASKRPASPMPV